MHFIREVFVPYDCAEHLRGRLPALSTGCEFSLFRESNDLGHLIEETLDDKSLSALQAFRENPQVTVLILRGLPVDSALPPTPYTNEGSVLKVPLTGALYLALYQHLRFFPVTYQGENEGRLFRDVSPKKSAVHERSSYGSSQTLGMHVDNCHLPLVPETERKNLSLAPEYLSFFGLRCDLKVPTRLSCLDEALAMLDPDTIRLLKQPLYELTMPDSFAERQSFVLPLLVQDAAETYYGRFDKEYTIFRSKEAQEAFDRLEKALYHPNVIHNFYLQKGDFLLFKNQRMTHAREAFTARFDGTDRWLLRLFGVSLQQRTVPVDAANPYYLKSY